MLGAGGGEDMGGSLEEGSMVVRVRGEEEERVARRALEDIEMRDEVRWRIRFEVV